MLVVGDYNLTNIKWSKLENTIIPCINGFNSLESEVLANFSYLNLKQFNLINNRQGSFLDLIFSNFVNLNVYLETCALLSLDYSFHELAY